MKLGFMQPYFFPYLGYFQLLHEVDRWIAFDDTQFINRGWINRNRILHPNPKKEWQFITVPLSKRGRYDRVCDICIASGFDWRAQILGRLSAYKKAAPYYNQTLDLVHSCFDTDETNLANFVIRALRVTAEFLGIQTPIEVFSGMNLELGPIEHPGQWALRVAETVGASHYVNPRGGKAIYKKDDFEDKGVKLSFLKPGLRPYSQRRDGFVAGLSIIDVLMWNSVENVSEMLRQDYSILDEIDASDSHFG
jgi:hypothetical protein